MFRPLKVSFQSAPFCTYSANKCDVHVYFDDAGEFNASLDILTNTEEKPYTFNALLYSFHNKKSTSRDYITFSLLNTGSVIIFKLVNQEGFKNFFFNGDGVNMINSIILESSKNIAAQIKSGLTFSDENSLAEHSKKLLEEFNLIGRKLFNSIKSEKESVSLDQNILKDVMENICSLLSNESSELIKAPGVKLSVKK